MSYETKALNKISQALGGQAKVQKNEILNEIAGNVGNISGAGIHICTSGEYDPETGLPTISNPDETTFYLVPGGENNNVYNEYIYANDKWELFGSYDIDPGYKVTNEEVVVFDGNVEVNKAYGATAYTSESAIIDADNLTGDTIQVIFENTEYELDKGMAYEYRYYGEPYKGRFSFDDYPFSVSELEDYETGSPLSGFFLATGSQGTYRLKVIDKRISYTLSDDFKFVLDSIIPHNIKDYGTTGIVENDLSTNSAGSYSHAEGGGTEASGSYSHAEGTRVIASGYGSHAEGSGTEASGDYSHAEGQSTAASKKQSHAEGSGTEASGDYSHAEGRMTHATGLQSHAEGKQTIASGESSHAEGSGTSANRRSQHVFGEYNLADTSGSGSTRGTYVEIVGNGSESARRSNARTLDWSGNEALAGSLTLGKGTNDETTITAAQLKSLLATLPTNS